MSAIVKASYDKVRMKLADILPLDTPFTVFIEPTRNCNFKCFYCIHSTKGKESDELKELGYEIKHMDMRLYEELLKSFTQFPSKLKRIVFSGLGEPLANPRLPQMIALAKQYDVSERLDIITNGSLLTEELSDALIQAGATRIQISIQGMNSKQYKNVTDSDIDFGKLLENIRYLYANRKSCTVFIKIIDALLVDEESVKQFFDLFGECSDQIFVEHLITLQHQMGDHGGRADDSKNLNNEVVEERKICPVIFYMLQIDADGNVFPCPVSGLPKMFSFGNCLDKDILTIWLGNRRRAFIKRQLQMKRDHMHICKNCKACSAVLDEREFLDDVANEILKKI